MGWMFSSAVFLFCVRVSDKVCVNVCVCVCVCARVFSFFPGQGNHVLYIGIIKFMTHRPRSRSLSHRTYSERERGRERTFIHFSMSLVITPRQDVDGGLVISNGIMKQGWHSDKFVSPSVC